MADDPFFSSKSRRTKVDAYDDLRYALRRDSIDSWGPATASILAEEAVVFFCAKLSENKHYIDNCCIMIVNVFQGRRAYD